MVAISHAGEEVVVHEVVVCQCCTFWIPGCTLEWQDGRNVDVSHIIHLSIIEHKLFLLYVA